MRLPDGNVCKIDKPLVFGVEPPVFGTGGENQPQNGNQQSPSDDSRDTSKSAQQLRKSPGFFTRAEVSTDFRDF